MTEAGLALAKLVSPQSRKGRLAADALRQKLEAGYRIKSTAVSRPVENPALDQDFVKR